MPRARATPTNFAATRLMPAPRKLAEASCNRQRRTRPEMNHPLPGRPRLPGIVNYSPGGPARTSPSQNPLRDDVKRVILVGAFALHAINGTLAVLRGFN